MKNKFSTNFLLYSSLERRMIFALAETPPLLQPESLESENNLRILANLKLEFHEDHRAIIARIDDLFENGHQHDKKITIQTSAGEIEILRELTPESFSYEIWTRDQKTNKKERLAIFDADTTGRTHSSTYAEEMKLAVKQVELALLKEQINKKKITVPNIDIAAEAK